MSKGPDPSTTGFKTPPYTRSKSWWCEDVTLCKVESGELKPEACLHFGHRLSCSQRSVSLLTAQIMCRNKADSWNYNVLLLFYTLYSIQPRFNKQTCRNRCDKCVNWLHMTCSIPLQSVSFPHSSSVIIILWLFQFVFQLCTFFHPTEPFLFYYFYSRSK